MSKYQERNLNLDMNKFIILNQKFWGWKHSFRKPIELDYRVKMKTKLLGNMKIHIEFNFYCNFFIAKQMLKTENENFEGSKTLKSFKYIYLFGIIRKGK